MEKVKLLILSGFVGVFTAIIYFLFEKSVLYSTDYIWNALFQSEQYRWRVLPICIFLTLVFFGFRHLLDKKSEEKESHSLGDEKLDISIKEIVQILLIGFLSLIAGVSLGPEAILVPASMILGMYAAKRFFPTQSESLELMKIASLSALFAAFFHSFFVGFLALFLLRLRSSDFRLTWVIVLITTISSAVSTMFLGIVDPTSSYFAWPKYSLAVRLVDIVIAVALILAGYAMVWSIRYSHDVMAYARKFIINKPWWLIGFLAGLGLSILYLLGGSLVEFTGNQAIAPLLSQASELGIVGLLWVLLIKVVAISFSKAFWYRGGVIFPTFFVASGIIALVGQLYGNVNFFLWFFAIIAGGFIAERRAKVLL